MQIVVYSSGPEFLQAQVHSVLLAVLHVCATRLSLSLSVELMVSPTSHRAKQPVKRATLMETYQ